MSRTPNATEPRIPEPRMRLNPEWTEPRIPELNPEFKRLNPEFCPIRGSVAFVVREFGAQSHSGFENSGFSRIRDSGIRGSVHLGFCRIQCSGIQGLVPFGIRSHSGFGNSGFGPG